METSLEEFSIEQLEAELSRRANVNKLTGVIDFEFAGADKLQRWADMAVPKFDAQTLSIVDQSQSISSDDGSHILSLEFEYAAIGASKSDVARFCVSTIGSVLNESGNQRVHPNGFNVLVIDSQRVPGRRIRSHRDRT